MTHASERYRRSYELWRRAPDLVLNGVQTLSKSPLHIALGGCPAYIERAKGAYFWDCDGNRFLDYVLALGPILLGYADERVDEAVKRQMGKGFLYSLSSPLEHELAELLCELIPSAEKVKLVKSGSEATSAAVRVARAYTHREVVAVCGYHGWHDWTVSRTARNAGVPACLRALVQEFTYNNLDSLSAIFEQHRNQVAAVVLEPVGMYAPKDDFLGKVAQLARENAALLVFDEIITGFRLSLGGAQSFFGVTPDLSAFGKAMANGYSISALVGKREIMDKVEDGVFISSTFGGDLLAITAALETLRILQRENVVEHILTLGRQLQDGLNDLIKESGIPGSCEGLPHKTFVVFRDVEGVSATSIQTLFRQECLARGVFLGYGHFVSFAHTYENIRQSLDVAREVLGVIREAIDRGNVASLLVGPVAEEVFKRY